MTRPPSGSASRRCCMILAAANVAFKDLHTEQSSLEDIFVSLVRSAP